MGVVERNEDLDIEWTSGSPESPHFMFHIGYSSTIRMVFVTCQNSEIYQSLDPLYVSLVKISIPQFHFPFTST